MKVIIAGSRSVTDYNIVKSAVEKSGWFDKITEIVSGCARGVDQLAIRFAKEHNIPVAKFPADWKKYNKSAGYIRNAEMAEYGDALIAIHRDNSRGTANMIKVMEKKGKPVFIQQVYDYSQNKWMILEE